MEFIMMFIMIAVSAAAFYSASEADRKYWDGLTDDQKAKLIHDREKKDIAESLKREAKVYKTPKEDKVDKSDLVNVGIAALIIGIFLG